MVRREHRPDEDFGDEVRSHLELEIDRLVEDGMTRDEARAAAVRAFGSPTRAREAFYERSRWMWLEQFLQDLRYAWRGLVANPAFLATTVLTLAVGLSLLTVAFTVFNAYVLRPFAVRDPHGLYRVGWSAPPDDGGQSFAWRDYAELRQRHDLFDAVIAEDTHFVSSDGRSLAAAYVSDNYFTALEPRLLLGRGLTSVDRQSPAAVLGYDAWTRLFARDRNAVGQTVDVDGQAYTVVGVLRPEFGGLDDYPRDIWMPAGEGNPRASVEMTVRLRPDVSAAQGEARLAAFAARMASPKTPPSSVRAVLRPNATANTLSVELIAVLSPVFAAFALVLLTACFNVSNVMLARAVARHREIAVRLSLGASRMRIARQLLTEGLLIAVLAGGLALLVASWLLRVGTVAFFGTLPPSLAALMRVAPMPIDARVFAFALAAAAAATLIFALVPALQASGRPLTDALRAQRSGTRAASRLRSGLVVAQVAMSVLLVVAAVVLTRNFVSVGAVDLGFRTAGVYSVNVRGTENRLIEPGAAALAADPRIADVAVTSGNMLFVTQTTWGTPAADRAPVPVRYSFVSPEFFPMIDLPVRRGRPFLPVEARTSARVALVSEAAARLFWPDADPIGQTLRLSRATTRSDDELDGYAQVTVIGTVGDVVSGLMLEGSDRAHVYLPATAADPHIRAALIRPRTGASFRVDMAREVLRHTGVDPETFEVIPMTEMRLAQMYPLRAAAWIGAILAGITLLLSVSGLYGVIAYTLAQRTREIGIRMALGATAAAVVALVMRQSARMAALGAAVGLVVSAAGLVALASAIELRQLQLLDPLPFAAAIVVVAAATAVAAYVPARRAARIDPSETLRAEA